MASHYAGSEREVRALSAFINLMRAADTVASHAHRRLARRRLTTSQFGVLEALLHRGPLHQGDLAGKLLRSGGSVTAVVAGLERRGLVRRERAAEDGRFVRVALTPEGRRLIAGIFPAHAREVAERFAALTTAEQEELRRLCRKLGTAVAAAG